MEDIFVYRSLLFAIIEYSLAALVLWKGRTHKKTIALILFFLAGYQLGEFIFLKFDSSFGIQFALFSTTLLPPLGLYLVEYWRERKYFYAVSQIISIVFALAFLLIPDLMTGTQRCFCLVKYTQSIATNSFLTVWGMYYIGSLTLALVLAASNYIREKRKGMKKFNLMVFLAYASFFPTSYIMVILFPDVNAHDLASLMCALAIFAAFIMTWGSLNLRLNLKRWS